MLISHSWKVATHCSLSSWEECVNIQKRKLTASILHFLYFSHLLRSVSKSKGNCPSLLYMLILFMCCNSLRAGKRKKGELDVDVEYGSRFNSTWHVWMQRRDFSDYSLWWMNWSLKLKGASHSGNLETFSCVVV